MENKPEHIKRSMLDTLLVSVHLRLTAFRFQLELQWTETSAVQLKVVLPLLTLAKYSPPKHKS